VLATFKGGDLEGCHYTHPLYERVSPLVLGGDYITTDSGTGLVHTAPGHGQEDYQVGGATQLGCRTEELRTALSDIHSTLAVQVAVATAAAAAAAAAGHTHVPPSSPPPQISLATHPKRPPPLPPALVLSMPHRLG
jgi:hypothetical protein